MPVVSMWFAGSHVAMVMVVILLMFILVVRLVVMGMVVVWVAGVIVSLDRNGGGCDLSGAATALLTLS